MDATLMQIRSLGQKDKASAYISLLNQILSQQNPRRDLNTLISEVLTQDHVGLVTGQQVLTELVDNFNKGIISDRNLRKELIQDALEVALPRLVSFEKQVRTLSIPIE